ncbi:MAG: gluconokinase [Caldilineaceae bacterium]
MPTDTCILTLDIGTSSTRALIFDAQARPLPGCLAQVINHLQTTADGGAVFGAAEILKNTVAVIDQVLAQAGDAAHRIGGVTMSTYVSNILGATADGRAVTPIYTYADTRNAPDAAQLRQELGAEGQQQAHDRTGCLVHTSSLPARFRWLARVEAEQLAQADHWLSIGEYLLWRFTGRRLASYSVASWTGLLDRRKLIWDPVWLAQLPLTADHLSPLGDVDEPLVGLESAWAERWPALAHAPWFPAIGDGAAANLGSGCGSLQPGAALSANKGDDKAPARFLALTIGTTGAMRTVLDADQAAATRTPDGLWLYRIDRQRALLGGATTEGGNLYAWLRQTLQLPEPAQIEAALAGRAPDSHSLTVLPFVAGERAPGWDDDARASLLGFTLNTAPLDIVQAGLEAIAHRFALICERIVSSLPPGDAPLRIIASGGALLSSPVWMQMMADSLGRSIVPLDEQEISARGLAVLGLEKLGVIADASELPPQTSSPIEPRPAYHEVFRAARDRQVLIYNALKDVAGY